MALPWLIFFDYLIIAIRPAGVKHALSGRCDSKSCTGGRVRNRAGELDERGWRELSAQVQGELAAWRRAHPRATLTEIEAATATALQQLQA
jgi:hypothetical protein